MYKSACFAVIIFLLSSISVFSQGNRIVISKLDNSEVEREVSEVKSIKANYEGITLVLKNDSEENFSYNNLSKVYFKKAVSVEDREENESITVFPNPAVATIKLNGADKELNATIYDIHGKIIVDSVVGNGSEINIEQLKSGVYFIKINSSIIRFVKL